MKVFDYINAINFTKEDLMTGTGNDTLAEKGYVAFITNKALSQFPDTIMYANEMNLNHHLDNKLQFDYFLHGLRKKKRFAKWAKKTSVEAVEIVREYYLCSYEKAQEIAGILTEEQILELKRRNTKE